MSWRLAALLLAAWALAAPAAASGAFGIESFSVSAEAQAGGPETQTGAHPYAFHLDAGLDTSGGALRDLGVHLPPGFLLTPGAVPECQAAAFATPRANPYEAGAASGESCPDNTQVGTIAVDVGGMTRHFGLFNLAAPYGAVAAIGASPFHTALLFVAHLREADAGIDLDLRGVPESFDLRAIGLTIWGRQPWAYAHDDERGNCLNEEDPSIPHGEASSPPPAYHPGSCTIGPPAYLEDYGHSYFTLPTSPCGGAFEASADATSWQGATATAATTLAALGGCHQSASVAHLSLSTDRTASRTGLAFELDINDGGGILNPEGEALPAIKRAVLSLPEGLTVNPSLAAGLGACSEAQFARESASSEPGAGCPGAAKIGEVSLSEPLGLPETARGSLYLATPHANPSGALLGVYLILRDARHGIALKSVGEISPDARGRLVASFDRLPGLLYERFRVLLRESGRSALISPPRCATYTAELALSSWADPGAVREEPAYFAIDHGADGGPCPTGAAPPFAPGLLAGALNPAPATYTPFYLRMTRSDPEQEITSYSATFPPGLLAKIAGVGECPEAAIEAARGHSGAAEQASPSCPESARIGRTMAGYGVGESLVWAPGSLYLAGPWHGSPLSVVAIDSAKLGPFDLGTVVVRSAVRIDTRNAQASIDAAGSDPIPHILDGIPLHVRDIRVYLDRPGFTLNGTSCDPLAVSSTLGGSGVDPFDPGDDSEASSAQRFQLLDCQALGFKPRLSLRLTGGARRGAYPSLRAVVRPRPGQANIASAQVRLPPSLFLAQEHLRRVCTRAQFAAAGGGGAGCPRASVYGHARAWTPLLDSPLEGPVYVRSSSHRVPDLVATLSGHGFTVVLEGKIDAVKGGLRAAFRGLPDAPASRFVMTLPGGRRGLLAVAQGLCVRPRRANSRWIAHDNATAVLRPRLNISCPRHRKRHGGRRR